MRNRIPINKSLIPYSFDIVLGNEVYGFEIKHNDTHDIYTVGLSQNGKKLAVEPLVYGIPLFADLYTSGNFPKLDLVPYDESGQTDAVTGKNFCETVFLTIDDEGDGT